jgi:hypothetical protein
MLDTIKNCHWPKLRVIRMSDFSFFKLSDRCLKAAIEIERQRAGWQYNLTPLNEAANEFSRLCFINGDERMIRIGCCDMLLSFYRERGVEILSTGDIIAGVDKNVQQLREAFQNPSSDKLEEAQKLCIAIHKNFLRRWSRRRGLVSVLAA